MMVDASSIGASSTTHRHLVVRELDGVAFEPFGRVLAADCPLRPSLDSGHWSIEHVRLPAGFGNGRLPTIARHHSYDQVFIGTEGTTVIAVAAATAPSDGNVGSADIVGFALRPGQTVLVCRNVWHTTVPYDGDSVFVNITRRDDGEIPGELGDADREYVTTIELTDPIMIDVAGTSAVGQSMSRGNV